MPPDNQTELTRTTNPSRDESVLGWKHRDVGFLFLTFIYSGKVFSTCDLFSQLCITRPMILSAAAAGGYLHRSSQYRTVERNESITHSFLNQISKASTGIQAGVSPATNHMGRLYCVRTMVLSWFS